MFVTLLNFFWIFISCFLVGCVMERILFRDSGKSISQIGIDLKLFLGGIGITVYVELFSVFYRVAFLSTLILLIFLLGIAFFFRRDIAYTLKKLCSIILSSPLWVIIFAALVIFFAKIAMQEPDFYDTSLYHAQAIRWIERYGIVKGLGNLHNRFAYNSSFLCLQAFFSWQSLLGQSLHGLNCFWGLLVTVYSFFTLSIFKDKTYQVSDCGKIIILFYVFISLNTISSPNTDFLAMIIVLYTFTKWFEVYRHDKNMKIRSSLCMLTFWGITLKLSIAFLAVISCYPFIYYIKKRKIKEIALYVMCAIAILTPFLIRNVIISGYLIYPYTILDFFDVDWKMPAYTVDFDKNEIVAWGRGLNDVEKYYYPFGSWFADWFRNLRGVNKVLLLLNASLILKAFSELVMGVKKKSLDIDETILKMTSIICLFAWLFSAPLIRYGQIYLLLLPMIYAKKILDFFGGNCGYTIIIIMVSFLCGKSILYLGGLEYLSNVRPADYLEYECKGIEFENSVVIYVPVKGDQTGYSKFPAIPYEKRLDIIEMREEGIEAGFRIKEKWKKSNINTYGYVE